MPSFGHPLWVALFWTTPSMPSQEIHLLVTVSIHQLSAYAKWSRNVFFYSVFFSASQSIHIWQKNGSIYIPAFVDSFSPSKKAPYRRFQESNSDSCFDFTRLVSLIKYRIKLDFFLIIIFVVSMFA